MVKLSAGTCEDLRRSLGLGSVGRLVCAVVNCMGGETQLFEVAVIICACPCHHGKLELSAIGTKSSIIAGLFA